MTKKEKEKLVKAKAQAKKKAEEARAKKKAGVLGKTDKHGFSENTIKGQFFKAISEKAITMKEVCKAKWNVNGKVQHGYFNMFRSAKLAAITKDGKMYAIGSKASPNKKKK